MAGHSSILEKVTTLVAPIVTAQQLELVYVEFKREGHTNYLRIFIDKPEGVTLDDCQNVSRECDVVLDIENIIQTHYVLEVSSPGLDRPLKTRQDYIRFQNRLVKLKTYRAVEGRKRFLGYLQGLTEESSNSPSQVIIVTQEGETIHIPFELITSARLEVEF